MKEDKTKAKALEACRAAVKYDNAIYSCADDPDKMSSYCTAQGRDLDALYFDLLSKARLALREESPEDWKLLEGKR